MGIPGRKRSKTFAGALSSSRPRRRIPCRGLAPRFRSNLREKLELTDTRIWPKDFIERVLGVKWAWISDESTLSDFCYDETNDALIQKIHATYGVDVSDISSGNLADIFDRIAERADLSA